MVRAFWGLFPDPINHHFGAQTPSRCTVSHPSRCRELLRRFDVTNATFGVVKRRCFVDQRDQLVGGFNPSKKYYYIIQIGSFPQVGVKIKNLRNHHLVNVVLGGTFLFFREDAFVLKYGGEFPKSQALN